MHHVLVTKCDVVDCCFNHNNKCRSVAIQVGDTEQPACDTFTKGRDHCGFDNMNAEVGACKTTHCSFNKDMLCNAQGINVGWKYEHAECLTFKPCE